MILPLESVRGVAAPLRRANIDTDQIIPSRFLTTTSREGLGSGLFHSLRFDDTGAERSDFVLNRNGYRAASILVTLGNFGCGSSREHAPWALLGFGIRCVIAPSFADIFADNCVRNGLLLVTLPAAQCEVLLDLAADPTCATWTIDLRSQLVLCPHQYPLRFTIDADVRDTLLAGRDEIHSTLAHLDRIEAKERTLRAERPWLPHTDRRIDGT